MHNKGQNYGSNGDVEFMTMRTARMLATKHVIDSVTLALR